MSDNPNVVKVVLDARQHALFFSRAPIPWRRDAFASMHAAPGSSFLPLEPSSSHDQQAGLPFWRHVGIYAYRMHALQRFHRLPPCPLESAEALEQLRALWNGWHIAVLKVQTPPAPGVDTPEDLARVRQLIQNGA